MRRSRAVGELRVEPIESINSVRRQWSALAAACGNIFSTPEWISLWWQHFGRDRPLLTALCRSVHGEAVAILPLYVATKLPVRIVRFLGYGLSDRLGPICDPADNHAVGRALRRYLSSVPRSWDVFLATQMPAEDRWRESIGGTVIGQQSDPTLRVGERSWDELVEAWSPKLREELRKKARALDRAHQVRYRLAADRDRLERDLDVLFGLHAARWGIGSSFLSQQAFHRRFAKLALERGWLRLWILEIDGAPAAADYAFRYAGAESYYQAGRDPAWNRFSVGTLLMVHSMREAVRDGMRECRLLRGNEVYKRRFVNHDPMLETIGLARGIVGHAALSMRLLLGASRPERLVAWSGG